MTGTKSGKIVVGVLAAIGVILVLHFFLFRENSRQFSEAKQNYENIRNELQRLGAPRPWPEIYSFKYETIDYEIFFQELIRDANLEYEAPFNVITQGTEAENREQAEKRLVLMWDKLDRLEELRDLTEGTRLTFMNSPTSWNLLDELPESVEQSGINPQDLMRNLQDTDALLGQIPADSNLYYQKELDYARQLNVLGLNLRLREQMTEALGQVPSIYYTLNRIDLIKDTVPRSELGGLDSEEEYNRRLFDLFRLEYVDWLDAFYNYYKQTDALIDLIERARTAGIDEILDVRMWEAREIPWPPREEQETEEGAEGEQQMADMSGLGFGMGFGMDPAMMGAQGMDPEMMGMMGMMMPAAGQAGVPEEEKDIVAHAVPLQMTFQGSNTAVMSFLYEAANSEKPYAIDSIYVYALPEQENAIWCQAVFKIVSYYEGFEDIPTTEMAPTLEQIEDEILYLLNEKKLIATKAGARELAEADGFADEMENIPPYEGDRPPPTLGLSQPQPGMPPGMPGMPMGMPPQPAAPPAGEQPAAPPEGGAPQPAQPQPAQPGVPGPSR